MGVVLINESALTGSTVHVVPVEGGYWGRRRFAAASVHRSVEGSGRRARKVHGGRPPAEPGRAS